MKKIGYFVLSLLAFFTFSLCASAKSIVVVNDYSVRFRSNPTTKVNNIISEFDKGMELDLLNDNAGDGNGCVKWYQVKYNNQVGYMCSEFVIVKEIQEVVINPEDFAEYSDYLSQLGFPDSYVPYLIKLHLAHPLWDFKVLKVNEKFATLINKEYTGYSKGWSLIEDYNRTRDGYKSSDSWSYDYLTDTYSNKFVGGGTYWFAANKETIAYYMDPRNFLNEKQVFMFETLSYNEKYHTAEGVSKMLSNTFMTGYADEENKKTYVDAFMDAAIKYNVSPYALISRVIQEVGAKGSTIVSGNVDGYVGYYNFYNIKAAGSTNSETIANGLKYAVSLEWNNPYKAILGGAEFIVRDYISVGQDTTYLQKWDMLAPNYANHQYMQNIEAPSTESIKTYNIYDSIDLVDSSFIFLIPVFNDMPDKTSLPNVGNPNNYLSSLSVNGNYLFEKSSEKVNYDLNLDGSTTSVEIAASKVNGKATVNGTGGVSLTDKKQSIPITVTAENGDVRVYTINITLNDVAKALDISEILRVLDIKNDGNYIFGFDVGYDVTKIIKSITDKESKAKVTYIDKDNKVKNDGIIASGDKLTIKTDHEEKTYTLLIYGDVNGDGKIAASDYVMIKNHIMDVKKLSSFEVACADVNKDGKIAASDYVAIKNHIMDVKKIIQ